MRSAQSCFIEKGRVYSSTGRLPRWRAGIVFCALGAVLYVLCTPANARSGVIWQGNDQAVTLVPQDEETAPPNDHPVTLTAQQIEQMLSRLRLRYSDQESDTPPVAVFNSEQLEILGEALATGLARAEPSQDVTFSITGAHRLSPGAFARRNRLTAGRVFFREGQLHLIFGEIQSPYRKKNIYGRIDEDFYPRQYGSRSEPEELESVVAASTGASTGGDPEGIRNDWVVFDPGVAAAEPPARSRPAGAPAPEASPGDESPAPTGRSAPGQSRPAPARAGSVSGDAAQAPDATDIEERLATLKRLRERELISEEAYREKVDEILEDL